MEYKFVIYINSDSPGEVALPRLQPEEPAEEQQEG
jgi:hypothetical protein